jgi:predicted DNA binding CopG/RHH family protein
MNKEQGAPAPPRAATSRYAKKEVKIKLDKHVQAYFKTLAKDLEIPYQKLITSYLHDCMRRRRKPAIKWS